MYSQPGGPQQQLIQHLARTYGGQPSPMNPPARSVGPISIDMAPGYTSYSIPGHLTPYGAFHEPPNQNEVGPNAGAWNTPAQPQSPDPAVATAIGAQPQGLHPMIQQALAHIQSMGLGNDDRSISPQGLGLHPQLDRFHAIHASQELAARMAELTQRSLASNQYRGRH